MVFVRKKESGEPLKCNLFEGRRLLRTNFVETTIYISIIRQFKTKTKKGKKKKQHNALEVNGTDQLIIKYCFTVKIPLFSDLFLYSFDFHHLNFLFLFHVTLTISSIHSSEATPPPPHMDPLHVFIAPIFRFYVDKVTYDCAQPNQTECNSISFSSTTHKINQRIFAQPRSKQSI